MKFIIFLLLLQTNLSFAQYSSPEIFVRPKTFNGQKDWTYFDGLGREVYFRGWNVSGSVKLTSMGFKPFKNIEDANSAFKMMAENTGTNAVRFTISWEGVHTDVDTIDENYLKDITSQIKSAISNKIYIILDYHQDLYSRYLFNSKSKTTGNGAPKFIIEGGEYFKGNCVICIQWFMNYALHKGVTAAFRGFWNNAPIKTMAGERKVQDEYLWQIEKTLTYLKENLTQEEFSYILGLDPFNEPVSGGREGLSFSDWNKKKLIPFYQKVKYLMDKTGWDKKILFAEPVMDLGAKEPFSQFIENPPTEGWSLNNHFYDLRQLRRVENGAYIGKIDKIKEFSRNGSLPPFLTEFGYWKENGKVKNHVRKINAIYQGMEISKEEESNFAKFYSPLIPGTQWNWDIYHNRHNENVNFSGREISEADAWNDENYSVVTDGGIRYDTPDRFIIERIFPKRCQGEILHFFYNAMPFDGRSEILEWGALKFPPSNDLHLNKSKFSLLVFQGINSNAPTEIFIPPHFNLESTYLITESKVLNLGKEQNDKIKMLSNTLYLWSEKNPSNLHFALIFEGKFEDQYLKLLQKNLQKMILNDNKSPVFLTGKVRAF